MKRIVKVNFGNRNPDFKYVKISVTFPECVAIKMYRESFKIVFQNPEYVKTFRNGGNNPFHIGCRRWILNHYFDIGEKS